MGGLPVGVDMGQFGFNMAQSALPSLVPVDACIIVGLVNMQQEHSAAVGAVHSGGGGGGEVGVEGARPPGGGGKKAKLSQARAAWQQVGSLGVEGLGVGGMVAPAGLDGSRCQLFLLVQD